MKALSIGAALFLSVAAGVSQTYQLTDLGAVIGTNSYAQGINNQGEVVGYWSATNGAHAFLYQSGAVTDLGLLGAGGVNNYALSINNAGQVVGFSETTNGASAFLFQSGTVTTLGRLGGTSSYALGINGRGQIVGYLDTQKGGRAFLLDESELIDLGTLGGTNSFAFGVNDSLQVAGASLKADNLTLHAFLWQNGVISDLNDLVALDEHWVLTDAHGINDLGNIAGWCVLDGQEHAFLYYNGQRVTDLGILAGGTNSYALGLNNSNQVVGASSMAGGTHAVMWENGVASDLNDQVGAAGWELKEANGINDRGEIVGWGMLNGLTRAFLLSPVTSANPLAPDAPAKASAAGRVGSVASTVTASLVRAATGQGPSVSAPQPGTNIVVLGGNATFTVTATGAPPLGYQWYFNSTNPIYGATGSNYTKLVVQLADAGNYSVVVTNAGGSVTSAVALLKVSVPPLIAAQPTNLLVNLSSNATFAVTISTNSTPPLSYQWYQNGTNRLTAATNAFLTITNVQTANVGYYTAVVTNNAGATVSSAGSLTVTMFSSNFLYAAAIRANGNAHFTNTTDGNVLELTYARTNQAGSAFFLTPISLVSNASFSTFFSFRLGKSGGISNSVADNHTGADGIAFIVQTLTNNVGANGGGMGYYGVTNSVGVEFDTWCNSATRRRSKTARWPDQCRRDHRGRQPRGH